MRSTNHASPGGPHHYSDAEMHNEDVSHESSDINIRTIISLAVGLAVVVVLAAGLMYAMFRILESHAEAEDPQLSPLAHGGDRRTGPKLLVNEPAGLRKFHAEETEKLETYGWVNQQAGVTHVPIEDAKKLIVQRGLPVRPGGAVEDPQLGTDAPAFGEASGGRTIGGTIKPTSASAAGKPAAAEEKR